MCHVYPVSRTSTSGEGRAEFLGGWGGGGLKRGGGGREESAGGNLNSFRL